MIDVVSLLNGAGLDVAPVVLMVPSIVVGVLALLFGYRLTRLFVFLVGFAIGTVVAGLFSDMPIAILIGFAVGALCCALWYLGVFALGALLGILVAMALGINEQGLVILIAILFGLLAVAIRKFMIIVSTSWFGANLITVGIAGLLNFGNIAVQICIAIFITGIGIVCQYTVTSGKRKTAPPSAVGEQMAVGEQESEKPQEVSSATE